MKEIESLITTLTCRSSGSCVPSFDLTPYCFSGPRSDSCQPVFLRFVYKSDWVNDPDLRPYISGSFGLPSSFLTSPVTIKTPLPFSKITRRTYFSYFNETGKQTSNHLVVQDSLVTVNRLRKGSILRISYPLVPRLIRFSWKIPSNFFQHSWSVCKFIVNYWRYFNRNLISDITTLCLHFHSPSLVILLLWVQSTLSNLYFHLSLMEGSLGWVWGRRQGLILDSSPDVEEVSSMSCSRWIFFFLHHGTT